MFLNLFGNVENTKELYAMSDLSVNTSIKEGIALTSYESLAMGVPVVSSDVGGQKELITEDVGVIVPCIQDEEQIKDYNYSDEEVENYVNAINKVISKLNVYKNNCRKRILEDFTTKKMIDNMNAELTKIVKKPNEEKIMNGNLLNENIDILKEMISTYFISSKQEYEWLVDEFNIKNVHKNVKFEKKCSKINYYEHTLEYKIKHPIVVVLRKLGIYNKIRKMLNLEYNN